MYWRLEPCLKSLSLFNTMTIPLIFFPYIVQFVGMGFVSIQRVQEVLMASEHSYTTDIDMESADAIVLDHATFSWDCPEDGSSEKNEDGEDMNPFALQEIDISIRRGTFGVLIGSSGAGKSTLLSGLLGELDCTSGGFSVNGSIAYCPQQAWIWSGSIRANILFGLPMDQERYDRVVAACALEHDLSLFKSKQHEFAVFVDLCSEYDMTEVGERGLNLSGGQKQRIGLARAMYSNADILLLVS